MKEQPAETTVKTGAIVAFLLAITVIGLSGLGIMLGGAVTLKTEAAMTQDVVGMFMFFTFFIVSLIEFFLVRQLSRLISNPAPKRASLPQPPAMPHELHPAAQPRGLSEAMPSVTENTTRTLEYARKEPPR